MGKAWSKDKIAEYKVKICECISIEGMSLVKVCKQKDFPSISFVYEWLAADTAFVDMYARACENRAEVMAQEILDICDATAEDVSINDDGEEIVNHNVIQRDRLRVDTRKFLLAKLAPKKYGEKIDVTSDGKPIDNKFEYTVVNKKE